MLNPRLNPMLGHGAYLQSLFYQIRQHVKFASVRYRYIRKIIEIKHISK